MILRVLRMESLMVNKRVHWLGNYLEESRLLVPLSAGKSGVGIGPNAHLCYRHHHKRGP